MAYDTVKYVQNTDIAAEVLKVMKTNTAIKELVLSNVGLKWYATNCFNIVRIV